MKLLCSKKGEGIISALYSMLILTIIFFIGIDIAGYTATAWKLRNACSETLSLMRIENGFDSETEQAFHNFLEIQGLDPATISVMGTPKLAQRGDTLTIKASTTYSLRSLKPLHHAVNFNIIVEQQGMAQKFIR